MQRVLYKEDAWKYVVAKMNMHLAHHLVDWQALGRFHKVLSWQRRAAHINFIFRWAPTNARKMVTGQSDTSLCPLCREADETTQHMLHYPCERAVKGRQVALDALRDTLDQNNTHPDIALLLILAVETDKTPNKEVGSKSDVNFKDIVDTQSQIGWDLVKYGFLSTEWKKTQHKWALQRDPNYSLNKFARWTKTVKASLWKYVADVWEHRNRVIHGKAEVEIKQKQLKKLQLQVKEILRLPPALGASDRHLLELCDVNRRCGAYLHHWVWAVRAAVTQETITQQKEDCNRILRYMRDV